MEKSTIDGFGLFSYSHIDNHIGERVEIGNGTAITLSGLLDAQSLRLAVVALRADALTIDGFYRTVEGMKGGAPLQDGAPPSAT